MKITPLPRSVLLAYEMGLSPEEYEQLKTAIVDELRAAPRKLNDPGKNTRGRARVDDPEASQDAADGQREVSGTLRLIILRYHWDNVHRGVHDYEMELAFPWMERTVSTRRSELVKHKQHGGWLEKTSERRPTARATSGVYRMTPAARVAVRSLDFSGLDEFIARKEAAWRIDHPDWDKP